MIEESFLSYDVASSSDESVDVPSPPPPPGYRPMSVREQMIRKFGYDVSSQRIQGALGHQKSRMPQKNHVSRSPPRQHLDINVVQNRRQANIQHDANRSVPGKLRGQIQRCCVRQRRGGTVRAVACVRRAFQPHPDWARR